MTKLKILTTHPVQYHVPFFRAIVDIGIDIDVAYFHQGAAGRRTRDAEFGIDIEWDMDLLSGYKYQFLTPTVNDYRLQTQLRALPGLLWWALANRQVPLLLVGWSLHVFWLVWLLRILFRMPVISFSETTPRSFASFKKSRWRIRLLDWLLKHSKACLYIGLDNRQFLLNHGVDGTRLFHTPYSVDNSHYQQFDTIDNRESLYAQFGLKADLPTFLFVGKFVENKRTLELLEAYVAAGLEDKAQLLYVGDGHLRQALEARIVSLGVENVQVVGFLNYTQIPTAYAVSNVLCLLSTETWGLVVNEAMACGCPVIVSDAVGSRADLVTSETGWVVPLDDKQALIDTLCLAYEQQSHWPRMGEAARSRVSEHTFARMAEGVKRAISGAKIADHE